MTVVRYEPWAWSRRATALLPRVDVREAADRYLVEVDLPGVAPADIEITTEQDVLTIRAERKAERREDSDEGAERSVTTFLRRFTLPEDADAGAVSARSVNGVLELSIAKQAKAQPRRIEVRAA